VLQGIVPNARGWSITSLSWQLVCDSIHRLCVGIWLGYRPGSLRRIFTGSYSLPPSLVAIWSFKFLGRWIHPTHLEEHVSIHLTLCFEFQLVQFKRLWVFRRFFCFYFASMITLSWLTSTNLECAYFHGFWCMVKLLVHEPLLIVWSNTTN
jgi:hypothetical protein